MLAGGAWAWTARDTGEQQAQAPEQVEQTTDAPQQVQQDPADLQAARTALQEAVAQGRSVLDASAGAVADDGVRLALAQLLDRADKVRTAPPGRLRGLADKVVAATVEVTSARDAWAQAEAARVQAEAQAQAARRAPVPPPPPSQVSCESTYTGPPFYASAPTPGGDGSNGRLPPEMLAAASWSVDSQGTPYYLRTDAAAALERLNQAFVAQFGHNLDLDLTYRDYDTQVAMRAALGTIAATPGTSRHGTGLALDVPELPCEYGWDTPQRTWLVQNGPSFGWTVPGWAQRNGSNPEYWHFEFVG